ncbi:hypothetical protein BC1002_7144 (plasmid) [Paraburkholderia atlantica]|uniref:Uncharacterized protein n=1 Tax=Paraburkholderia atlantica TaxID=2654982 RepID=D5WNL1_PARAM|nr:hypothetical protein BC1002_7144 [Paraburkholderia atlantica]
MRRGLAHLDVRAGRSRRYVDNITSVVPHAVTAIRSRKFLRIGSVFGPVLVNAVEIVSGAFCRLGNEQRLTLLHGLRRNTARQ